MLQYSVEDELAKLKGHINLKKKRKKATIEEENDSREKGQEKEQEISA